MGYECVCVTSPPPPPGLTALHTAVLSHNAVVQELGVAPPHSAQTQELLQRRKALGECVSTLLLMGASYRTKVSLRGMIRGIL